MSTCHNVYTPTGQALIAELTVTNLKVLLNLFENNLTALESFSNK